MGTKTTAPVPAAPEEPPVLSWNLYERVNFPEIYTRLNEDHHIVFTATEQADFEDIVARRLRDRSFDVGSLDFGFAQLLDQFTYWFIHFIESLSGNARGVPEEAPITERGGDSMAQTQNFAIGQGLFAIYRDMRAYGGNLELAAEAVAGQVPVSAGRLPVDDILAEQVYEGAPPPPSPNDNSLNIRDRNA